MSYFKFSFEVGILVVTMTQLDAVAKEKALIDKTNEDLESKLKSVGEKHKEHCCRMDEIIQKDKGNLEIWSMTQFFVRTVSVRGDVSLQTHEG